MSRTTPAVAGIQTTYAGTEFRSRLEARWAAFFDLIGWKWEYEPFDLDWYIPDFLLLGEHPILVEVKPIASTNEAMPVAANLPDAAYEFVVVGSTPLLEPCNGSSYSAIGLISQIWENNRREWDAAAWAACHVCNSFYFTSDYGSWIPHGNREQCVGCRKPGGADEAFLQRAWNEARNITQWKKAS